MGKQRQFLPQLDIEDPPLLGTRVSRMAPTMVRTKSWVYRMFSVFGICTILFGGTIFGLSFHMIGENQVGYYDQLNEIYYPGIYFKLPWTKEELHILDVGVERLTISEIKGKSMNDTEYLIQEFNLVYNVSDIPYYVRTVKDNQGIDGFLEMLRIEVINTIQGQLEELTFEQVQDLTPSDIVPLNPNTYGITIKNYIFTKPVITSDFPYEPYDS